MNLSDFIKYQIVDFTPAEVMDTGASLHDVQLITMVSMQDFRTHIRRRVHLLFNGITTGTHKAPWHNDGLAVDGALYTEDGPTNIHYIFKAALSAGFHGIGIYYNGEQYSFHLDHRPIFKFWGGWKDKKKGINDWQWVSLLSDPAKN